MRVYRTDEFMTDSRIFHIFKGGVPTAADAIDMPHTHEFIEIVYVLSGTMKHNINGVLYEAGAGDILLMNRGCVHGFDVDGSFSYINILFSPEIINADSVTPDNAFSVLALTAFDELKGESEFGKLSFLGAERREIENIVFSMLHEYQCKQASWNTVVGNYLSTLIIKLLRKSKLNMGGVESERIWRELSDYIDENLGTRLTLTELAERCFYNPSYFSRIFKEKFGVSFVEYVANKRLDCALRMLSETDLSIDEISVASGFSDRSSMHHAFSRYLGQTPADYRKK